MHTLAQRGGWGSAWLDHRSLNELVIIECCRLSVLELLLRVIRTCHGANVMRQLDRLRAWAALSPNSAPSGMSG